MRVESRDSLSLKPAELDEFGQLLVSVELPLKDDARDDHVERFPLVTPTCARARRARRPVRSGRGAGDAPAASAATAVRTLASSGSRRTALPRRCCTRAR